MPLQNLNKYTTTHNSPPRIEKKRVKEEEEEEEIEFFSKLRMYPLPRPNVRDPMMRENNNNNNKSNKTATARRTRANTFDVQSRDASFSARSWLPVPGTRTNGNPSKRSSKS